MERDGTRRMRVNLHTESFQLKGVVAGWLFSQVFHGVRFLTTEANLLPFYLFVCRSVFLSIGVSFTGADRGPVEGDATITRKHWTEFNKRRHPCFCYDTGQRPSIDAGTPLERHRNREFELLL